MTVKIRVVIAQSYLTFCDSMNCPSYLDRFLTSMNKLEYRMDIPAALENIPQVPATTRENP